MEVFNGNLSKANTNNVEMYFLEDFNINIWQNRHHVFQKHNLHSSQSVPNDIKYYLDFCTVWPKSVN